MAARGPSQVAGATKKWPETTTQGGQNSPLSPVLHFDLVECRDDVQTEVGWYHWKAHGKTKLLAPESARLEAGRSGNRRSKVAAAVDTAAVAAPPPCRWLLVATPPGSESCFQDEANKKKFVAIGAATRRHARREAAARRRARLPRARWSTTNQKAPRGALLLCGTRFRFRCVF